MSGGRRPTDQVSERWYHIQPRYPIFEVLPKREAMFATRLFETGEGVATTSPRLATGAGTDLALLDPVAQVIFTTVESHFT